MRGGWYLSQVRWMLPLPKGRPSGGSVTKNSKKTSLPAVPRRGLNRRSFVDWFMSVYTEPVCLFFLLFFQYFIHDKALFHFFSDGLFHTGNSPDILNRIDTVNQYLTGRCNNKIS